MSKINYEKHIVALMIEIYCNNKHKTKRNELCDACGELISFTHDKLEKCPFAENKGACSNCKVHCYKKTHQREKIRKIMKYSGPRMLLYHPKHFFIHYFKIFTNR